MKSPRFPRWRAALAMLAVASLCPLAVAQPSQASPATRTAAETERELALLREQLRAAETRGEAGRVEADQLRTRINQLQAQTRPPGDEAIQLNVFEVSADRDDSYGALNSNSITRLNQELVKLPISADIYNEAFMRDVNAITVEAMIAEFTAGAGFASPDGPASTDNAAPGERQANANVVLRGLTAPGMQLDAFMSLQTYSNTGATATGVTNNFNIERTEVIMGPQSLLYGNGGGGGVINLVSKQARFNRKVGGNLRFQTDDFGSKIATLDVGWGNKTFAVRGSFIHQYQKTRRVNIYNDLDGQYLQLAWRPFANTTIRLSGMQSSNFRTYGSNLSVNAQNAAFDSRHNQRLRYLLATNQINQAASGPSGAGAIADGQVNWGNVDSWFGDARSERTMDTLGMLTVETKWSRTVTTQLAVGYKDFYNQLSTQSTAALLAPNQASNTLRVWAIGGTGGGPLQRNIQPAKTFPARFTVAFENQLFGGRARSQTVVGGDYLKLRSAFIGYSYYLADQNWNAVVNPATMNVNNGRTLIPNMLWPMGTRPGRNPIPGWTIGDERLAWEGRNYVLMQQNPANVFPRSEENPHGVTLGGVNYNIVNIENEGIFGVNDTTWMGGKLNTLIGFRAAHAYARTDSQGSAISVFNTRSGARKVSDEKFLSYSVGANYALRDWLRPYFAVSDSYNPPIATNNDPLGNQTEASHAIGSELGVKVQNASGTVSGSLALYHTSAKNENFFITSTLSFDINPSGLNGRFGGAPSTIINVDREARGAQVSLTATPTRNWRMRLSAATVSGETSSTKTYQQVYNDQFHANAQGQVTYRNGTVVWVPNTFSANNLTVAPNTANAQPLTIQMMSTPGSVYYATPQPITGAITPNSNAGRVLQANNALTAANGPILTGATGLPISQIQINPGFTPPGEIPVTKAGELTTNYPEYSANFTSMYTFTEAGWLRGFRAGGSVFASWGNRRFYYYPNGAASSQRELFSLPTQWRVDLILGYERKIGRYSLGAQLNVRNLLNRYEVLITPNAVSGWAGPNSAIFAGEPRSWEITTTLGF